MQTALWQDRVIVWFSCGAASAVAAKKAVEHYRDKTVEVIYCDTLRYEHPDNIRFMHDVQDWIGQEIKLLRSGRYADIMAVFRGERFLVGPHGAPCTRILKRDVRIAYSSPGDVHVFGLTADEQKRIERFEIENPTVWPDWVLRAEAVTKSDCYRILTEAGIALPDMYKMGYRNNNCIGCVKGGAGYWNKIRTDFPARFDEMAQVEREIGATICKVGGKRVYLDELPKSAGRYQAEDIECGVQCVKV